MAGVFVAQSEQGTHEPLTRAMETTGIYLLSISFVLILCALAGIVRHGTGALPGLLLGPAGVFVAAKLFNAGAGSERPRRRTLSFRFDATAFRPVRLLVKGAAVCISFGPYGSPALARL
jgi:hypothetical protein